MDVGSRPTVEICEPGRTPLRLVLDGSIVVGRDCDGILLADRELSRQHLRLTADGPRVIVEDLDSMNGTTIDGQRLAGPIALRFDQVLHFGRCRLAVVAPDRERGRATLRADPPTSIDVVAAAATTRSLAPWLRAEGSLTIVFSDIDRARRASTRVGADHWAELLGFHNSVMRRHVQRCHGTEVLAHDDGFMFVFSHARAAARCAVEIMGALAVHGRSRPADALRIRIGMHTTEGVEEHGELFGRPIELAAWIANQAKGAEILVSSLVREILESRGDVTFGETRYVTLDGCLGAYAVHPIDWSVRID
jgi:class 3 adenylate cyclase